MTRLQKKMYIDDMFGSKYEVLKSSMVGSTYFAAVRTKATGEVWAAITLTSMRGGEFFYKDMDETCGPCEVNCPVSILDLLTETEYEYAKQWRQKCREYHRKQAEQRRLQRTSLTGYVVSTVRGYVYKLTRSRIFFGGISQFKVWPTREQAEEVVARFSDENRAMLVPVVCEISRESPAVRWP